MKNDSVTWSRFRPWQPRTWGISVRLTLWFSSAIAFLLLGFAVLTYFNFQRSLHSDFDQHLTHELRVFLPAIASGPSGPYLPPQRELTATAYRSNGIYGTFVRLIDLEGRVVYRSPNFEGEADLEVQIPTNRAPGSVSRPWAAGPVRSLYYPLANDDGLPYGWAEVTGYEWSLHTELDRLTKTFALGILLAVLISSFGGYFLAQRALSPVADITGTANRIRASHLSERIPVRGGPEDELSELTKTINGLLDRIEESFRRERRFSANAAHELVTPLAMMRAELELALGSVEGNEPMEATLVASLADIDNMTGIVRSLLTLASAERQSAEPRELLDLRAVVSEQVAKFQERADLLGVALEFDASELLQVNGDQTGLRTVVDNLVDNALKYSASAGSINVSLTRSGREAHVAITDNGIGFDPADGEHLFDRFYRGQMAAVQRREGSGLGLSIVSTVVAGLGGRVWATSDGPGKGSTFGFALPLG